eukprot:IDg18050t1
MRLCARVKHDDRCIEQRKIGARVRKAGMYSTPTESTVTRRVAQPFRAHFLQYSSSLVLYSDRCTGNADALRIARCDVLGHA